MTKRETWEHIKKNHPDMAAFIIEVSAAFGKLDGIKYVSRETKRDKK